MSTSKTDIIFDDRKIVLKSVYDKAGIKYYVQPCRDKYGDYPECVKRVTKESEKTSDINGGEMILSEQERNLYSERKVAFFPVNKYFEIYSGKTYDLDNMWEAAEWEAIKNCPLIAKDRFEKDAKGNLIIDGPVSSPNKPSRYGVAELYIDRPGVETQRRVKNDKLIHTAKSYIYDDEFGVDGHLNIAKLLGKDMSNQSIADVLDYLVRVAEKNPQKIIDLYTGTDTSLRLMFIDAKEKKVIFVKNKLFMYGDISLGATSDSVISWMKNPKNKKILELIRKDTYIDYESKEDQK